jgi:hypothetical protein
MAYQTNYTGMQLDHAVDIINRILEDPNDVNSNLVGYRMCGIALPSMPTPSYVRSGNKLCFMVVTPGKYAGFGDLELLPGYIGLLLWDGEEWTIQAVQIYKVLNSEDEYDPETAQEGMIYYILEEEE